MTDAMTTRTAYPDTAPGTEITSAWPDRARLTRDNPNSVIHVFDARRFGPAYDSPPDWQPSALAHGLHAGRCAVIYLRHTEARTYAVTLYSPPNGQNRVFYGWARGWGYDRTAAALAGHQISEADDGRPIFLTDHCGLDRYDPATFPPELVYPTSGKPFRCVQVHRGSDRTLPPYLVAL